MKRKAISVFKKAAGSERKPVSVVTMPHKQEPEKVVKEE